jgi:hypothetical protein
MYSRPAAVTEWFATMKRTMSLRIEVGSKPVIVFRHAGQAAQRTSQRDHAIALVLEFSRASNAVAGEGDDLPVTDDAQGRHVEGRDVVHRCTTLNPESDDNGAACTIAGDIGQSRS